MSNPRRVTRLRRQATTATRWRSRSTTRTASSTALAQPSGWRTRRLARPRARWRG